MLSLNGICFKVGARTTTADISIILQDCSFISSYRIFPRNRLHRRSITSHSVLCGGTKRKSSSQPSSCRLGSRQPNRPTAMAMTPTGQSLSSPALELGTKRTLQTDGSAQLMFCVNSEGEDVLIIVMRAAREASPPIEALRNP